MVQAWDQFTWMMLVAQDLRTIWLIVTLGILETLAQIADLTMRMRQFFVQQVCNTTNVVSIETGNFSPYTYSMP